MTTYVQNANAELQQANDQLRQVRVPVLMAFVVEMISPLYEYLLFIFIYFFALQTVDVQQQVLGAVNDQLQQAQDEHKKLLREHVQVCIHPQFKGLPGV